MVVPDAALVRSAGGLRHTFASFTTPQDAAASSPDPDDTGAVMTRRGRIAGYIRGRYATGAFSRRAPRKLLLAATSAILWRDARAASASIRRDISDDQRLTGRTIRGSTLVSFDARPVGAGATLLHIRSRPTNGTDQFTTEVVFSVDAVRGNALVVRGDRRSADGLAQRLAEQLRRRIRSVLGR